MSEAPEKIWLIETDKYNPYRVSCSTVPHSPDESTEYVRADRIEALEREVERLTLQGAVTETTLRAAEAREARLNEALRQVRHAIMNADPAVLTDTFWMPDNVFKGGTVVDFIDAALSGSGSGWLATVEAARSAVEELANTQMQLPLSEWNRISNAILAALPAAPQQGGE